MCIICNNVETARMKIADIDEEVEGVLSGAMTGILSYLKSTLVKLLGVLVFRVKA